MKPGLKKKNLEMRMLKPLPLVAQTKLYKCYYIHKHLFVFKNVDYVALLLRKLFMDIFSEL